jgi:hypothetical protein
MASKSVRWRDSGSGSVLLAVEQWKCGTKGVSRRKYHGVAMMRFRVAMAFALIFAVMPAATIIWPQWIERVLHVEPDAGSGAIELLIVAAGILSVAAALVAAVERRRLHRV